MATVVSRDLAPEAVAPPPGNPRFPLLDGLRAIAAGFVLVYHVVTEGAHQDSRFLQNLSLQGIAIFFVLSGFLLYRPFIRARLAGNGVPSVTAYARRRVLRIIPAYWLALTFALLVAGGSLVSNSHVPIYYLLLQDYVNSARYHGLSVAWTLSIEATYYVALPVVAYVGLLLARGFSRRWRLLPELLIVAGFVLITAALQVVRPTAPATILSFTDWFAGGMLLAIVTFTVSRALPTWASVALWIGAAALFAVEDQLHYGSYAAHLLLVIAAVAIVASAVFPAESGPVSAVLRSRALLWLGLVSYGIYLWHVPLMDTILKVGHVALAPLLVLTIALTIAVAAASYHFFESPILRLKDRRRR